MRLLFCFALLIGITTSVASGVVQPSQTRTWKFPSGTGSVEIKLVASSSTDDHLPLYVLQIISRKAAPTVHDEAEALKVVTQEMERDALAPNRIVRIQLDLIEPDVKQQLAQAANVSKVWIDARASDQGLAVTRLLNDIRAYAPFNDVFSRYGLSVEVNHAEYISTVTPESVGLKRGAVAKVPSSASLDIFLRKKP